MPFHVPSDLSGGLYFLDGKRTTVQASTSFPVYEQRIGKVVAQCPIADEKVVSDTVESAKKAQKAWAELTHIERARVLNKAVQIITDNLEDIAVWEVKTNGKSIYEARFDIGCAADTLQYFAGIAAAVLQGDHLDLSGGQQSRFAYVRREPFGVVGCIGAWNYPLLTCMWKVAPALAAGNAVVYKPSPFSPASPVLLGEIFAAAGLPNGIYNVVQGEAVTGQALCMHPHIGKVSFTGSVPTGMKIQQACSTKNIKPLTLELGGKSALVIFDDSDVKGAVAAAMLANFANQGQVCCNATRVFVQKGILDKFTQELLKECNEKLVVGDPLDDKTRVGANINEGHLNKILSFIESAKKEGGKVLRGGVRVHPKGVEDGYYLEPAVITGLTDNAHAVREEIFGACMLILPFDTEEEAIHRVNDTSFGLGAGVYTGNLARGHRVAAQLEAGTVWINTYNDCEANVPFGGYKNSGHGRENCPDTLRAYTQLKAVYVNVKDSLDHIF